MSLATNNVPVSLPSLSKLTGLFSPFPSRLADDIHRNDSLPGLPEPHYNGYQKSLNSMQNYPDKSIVEHPDPVNIRSQYECPMSPPGVLRRASDSTSTSSQQDENSSDQILLEKRKRNANASARFRDRRKQRERELLEKYHALEEKTKQFESALKQIDPNHPLIATQNKKVSTASDTLSQRVNQLESLMQHFNHEKETSVQRLKELEEENKYLKSLIVPIGHHSQ